MQMKSSHAGIFPKALKLKVGTGELRQWTASRCTRYFELWKSTPLVKASCSLQEALGSYFPPLLPCKQVISSITFSLRGISVNSPWRYYGTKPFMQLTAPQWKKKGRRKWGKEERKKGGWKKGRNKSATLKTCYKTSVVPSQHSFHPNDHQWRVGFLESHVLNGIQHESIWVH